MAVKKRQQKPSGGGGVPVHGFPTAPAYDPSDWSGDLEPWRAYGRAVAPAAPGPVGWAARRAWERLETTGCPHVHATQAEARAHVCDFATHPAARTVTKADPRAALYGRLTAARGEWRRVHAGEPSPSISE